MSRKKEEEIKALYKLSVKDLERKKEAIKNHYCFLEKGVEYYNVIETIETVIKDKKNSMN